MSRDEFENIYREIWIGYLCILFPIFFINSLIALLSFFSPLLKRTGNYSIVRYLFLEDAIFSFIGLIQTIVNLTYSEMDPQRCQLQLFFTSLFIPSLGFTLCVIVYNGNLKTQGLSGLRSKTVLKIHIIAWILVAIIAVSCSYILDPNITDSYCNFTLVNYSSGILFYAVGIFLPGTFLTYYYIKIYKDLKRTSEQNDIKISFAMFIYLISYYLCHFPILMISIIEASTDTLVDFEVHLVANYLLRLSSLLNPILYFWLDEDARTIFCHHWNALRRKNKIMDIRIEEYKVDPKIIPSLQAPLINNLVSPTPQTVSPDLSTNNFVWSNPNTP